MLFLTRLRICGLALAFHVSTEIPQSASANDILRPTPFSHETRYILTKIKVTKINTYYPNAWGTFSSFSCQGFIYKLANGIYSAIILNIHVIFSIIERVSIKRLTEDLLLIIDARCDT